MIRYILDTDILSLFQFGMTEIGRAIRSHSADELAITVISVEEQLTGWYSLIRRVTRPDDLALAYQSLADNVRFFSRFTILSFTERAITRYELLKRSKLNVGKMDLRVAAIALEEGCIVVTRNTRDFQRIPGLAIENWAV